jgi:hypothetical protein
MKEKDVLMSMTTLELEALGIKSTVGIINPVSKLNKYFLLIYITNLTTVSLLARLEKFPNILGPIKYFRSQLNYVLQILKHLTTTGKQFPLLLLDAVSDSLFSGGPKKSESLHVKIPLFCTLQEYLPNLAHSC